MLSFFIVYIIKVRLIVILKSVFNFFNIENFYFLNIKNTKNTSQNHC